MKKSKKIGFVIPWYSENIPGGAEMELRGLSTHLHEAGVPVEILTTCVKEFHSDWNVDYFNEGIEVIHGFYVRRFKVRKRNTRCFDEVNIKLMNNERVSEDEEHIYINEMINSPDMYNYIRENKENYRFFVFIPYMFGITYNGILACPEKAILIPCLHDEGAAHMKIFKNCYSKICGMVFNAEPERKLADRIFDLTNVHTEVLGIGLNTELHSSAVEFRKKYKINDPFILYAGRKDEGKNVHSLVDYYTEYIKDDSRGLKLVLIGGGSLELPQELVKQGRIIDLGFVDIQDKYNAQAAAALLCQPSKNESFSLVIMESWLCKRPVLVHEDCAVTKNFVKEANGGLYFKDYLDFKGCVDFILDRNDVANAMGQNGRKYVLENFAWDVVVDKYLKFFDEVEKCGKKLRL